MIDSFNPLAFPLADEALEKKILELVRQAAASGHLTAGTNNATESVKRGASALVVMAADTDPIDLLTDLILKSEDCQVSYVFVGSKKALVAACGVSRPVKACSITAPEGSQLGLDVESLWRAIEESIL